MEIIKTDEEKGIETGIYKPDKKEQELIGKVSDEIIDIIDKHGLTGVQQTFLLQCLVDTNNELNGILGVQLNETSDNTEKVKSK